MKNKLNKNFGFTLIELLVVIVIIGILATLATVGLNSVRAKARDAKRISDIRQVQSALELYLNENNSYPTTGQVQPGMPLTSPDGSKTYMSKVPGNPKPWAEGSCSSTGAEYSYISNYNNTYQISYCLANSVNEINAGSCVAMPGNICSRCTASCSGKNCGDSDGCGGKCKVDVTLTSGSLVCTASTGQLYCGTTLVASSAKVNQCSGNSATCSGATCSGSDICANNICAPACVVDSDCGFCKKCSSGGCINQSLGEDRKSECSTTNCATGNCDGSGSCGGTYSACSGGQNCCKGDNTCGVWSNVVLGYMTEKYLASGGPNVYFSSTLYTSPATGDCSVTSGWTLSGQPQYIACQLVGYSGANSSSLVSGFGACSPQWYYYRYSCERGTCN